MNYISWRLYLLKVPLIANFINLFLIMENIKKDPLYSDKYKTTDFVWG